MSRYTSQYDYRQEPRHRASSAGLLEAGLTLLGGLAIGAGVMYLLDPDEGPNRRKYIRKTTGGALHSVGDLFGSAYDSVSSGASAVGDTASSLTSSAGDLFRRSRDTAMEYVPGHADDDDDTSTGLLLTLILGGSALAAVAYMLTTEYDAIRRGDLRSAASNAYTRASDAVSDVAHRTTEYFGGQEQGTQSSQSA
jgi:hypothetical protein